MNIHYFVRYLARIDPLVANQWIFFEQYINCIKKKIFIVLLLIHFLPIHAQLTAPSYSVKNLKANSKYSDFGTAFFGKNKIVFSSSRNDGISNRKWEGNDQPFLNLYIGDVTPDGEIEKVGNFSQAVNSKYHDAFVAFTPNLDEVYFTSNMGHCWRD